MRIEISVKFVPDGSDVVTIALPVVCQQPPPLSTRGPRVDPKDWFDQQDPRKQRHRKSKAPQDGSVH